MERAWDSYPDFYLATYPDAITLLQREHEVSLLECAQSAGDWSDAPSPDLVLTVVTGGNARGSVDVGSGRHMIQGLVGEMLVTPPGTGTAITVEADHRILNLSVPYTTLQRLCIDMALPSDGNFGALHRGTIRNSAIRRCVEAIWADSLVLGGSSRAASEERLIALAGSLRRESGASRRSEPGVGGLAAWRVRRVVDRMAADLHADIGLEAFANDLGLSPFHFCRAFRRSTGHTPHQMIIRMRMEQGRRLLETTQLAIVDIAASVGYASGQSFSRVFHRVVGEPPVEYRRRRATRPGKPAHLAAVSVTPGGEVSSRVLR